MFEKTIGKTNSFICRVRALFDPLKVGTLKFLSNKAALTSSESHLYTARHYLIYFVKNDFLFYTAKNAPVVTRLLQACYNLLESGISQKSTQTLLSGVVTGCLQTCSKFVITETQQLPPTRLYQAVLATL